MDLPTRLDPDRFFNLRKPGSQEWWYFDAISDDGRDVLVIIFYAGLPFDPSYGVAAIRHARDPARHPAPDPLDHSAVGLSWHRDGKLVAYALNAFRADAFDHRADPFGVGVASSRIDRLGSGAYRLEVDTPSVKGKPIRASVGFHPAPSTGPIERNLGSAEHPHHWILAAADCRVEGSVAIGDRSAGFVGRGYHDHNAGSEEISLAMRRWEWGRVHRGNRTDVYYRSRPQPGHGPDRSLWITCVDGRPESVVDAPSADESGPMRNAFGVRHAGRLGLVDPAGRELARSTDVCLDDGPFYRRWVSRFSGEGGAGEAPGISEVLDTRNLNKFWFNWMIPYRLKRPAGSTA